MTLITLNTNIERHYLQHEDDVQPVLVEEPIGWKDNSNQGLSRSKDSDEFISKSAKQIKFIGKGRDYIKTIESIYGTRAKIRYIIVKENPEDSYDFYKDIYFLDLKTFKDKSGQIEVKANEGGMASVIKNRKGHKVEFDRETTIDGKEIQKIPTRKLLLSGRRIFLRSILKEEGVSFQMRNGSKQDSRVFLQTAIPLKVLSRSHEEIKDVYADEFSQQKTKNPNFGSIGLVFFLSAERDKNIDLEYNIDLLLKRTSYRGKERDGNVTINLVVYQNSADLNLKERIEIYNLQNPHSVTSKRIQIQGNKYLELKKGDSLSIEILSHARLGTGLPYYSWGRFDWDVENSNCTINLSEDSEVKPSYTDVVQIHELLEKEVEIISGKEKSFYSELFGRKELGYENDGEFSGITVSNGLWIRGFDSKEDKKPSISFKEIFDSLNACCGVGMMIEKIGFNERLRIENLDFFYMPYVTMELPFVVSEVDISPAIDFMYSSYEFGYKKGGDGYEEATGIGEYNGKASYSNILDHIDRNLSVLSDIRADSSMPEFARRKHKSTHPLDDTRYDMDNVFIDALESETDILIERKWQHDFDKQPEGIYDPDSATNLRFTPSKMRDRRKLFLASSLYHHQDSDIRFISSNCNSNLKTESSGAISKENGEKKVSEYGRPRFKPYWVKFTHPVSYSMSKRLRSKVIIEGKERYVFYGILKYRVSENVFKYGYLFEVKEKGKGEWKVLMANR
ncbi:hypothetical protein BTO06_09780 [Tenacibaculum sp. SZ-18]|uniref:hypothetical protein n=1 Tax=Tenacibaculum sp. SZ-18 TaxID=754423 RepID=UPI000C2D19A3|nr:hypothetical protein [Tenacibaculum sp. SZ-18]AUC15409.1 hypothetical protein BTO06_09780 [Tenacibaculum sp. SZ-18]